MNNLTDSQMVMLYMLYLAKKNKNARERLAAKESTKLMNTFYSASYANFVNDFNWLTVMGYIEILDEPNKYTRQFTCANLHILKEGEEFVENNIDDFTTASQPYHP